MFKKKIIKEIKAPCDYKIIIETKYKKVDNVSVVSQYTITCVCKELYYLNEVTTKSFMDVPSILKQEKTKFEEFYNNNL